MTDRWVYPAGTRARDGVPVTIDADIDGWNYTGLTVLALDPGQQRTIELGDSEGIVVPLAGSCAVQATDADGTHHADLAGRDSVFSGPTDTAYLPTGSRLTVTAGAGSCRIALATALTNTALTNTALTNTALTNTATMPATGATAPQFQHLPAAAVPVELRGSGRSTREVRNFGTPQVLAAHSIIACEVVTPAGNWSSYPPHKHDVQRPGVETELEEIYYFEIQATADAPPEAEPLGYQRVYASDERPIDVLAEVRTGDVVLVPYGWHGPAMAVPGYDMYYLNVMAGPGPERAWLICDDPAHGWVRAGWPQQPTDPRLPMGDAR